MSNFPEPPEERKYIKAKRPYDFGSIGYEGGSFVIAPARVESQYPNAFRQAVYPDGSLVTQGAYAWSQGSEGGVVWRDLPLVYVNEEGQEIQ